MSPTSGEAWVGGYSVLSDAEQIKDKIGYMSQRFGLYEDLTVMENILFYADIYEVGSTGTACPDRTAFLVSATSRLLWTGLPEKLSGG